MFSCLYVFDIYLFLFFLVHRSFRFRDAHTT